MPASNLALRAKDATSLLLEARTLSVQASVLAGKVVRNGTQEALANVIVEAFRPNSDRPLRVSKTDSNGRFRFSLPPGNYVLQFSLLGYDRVRQPVEYNVSGRLGVEVGLPPGT